MADADYDDLGAPDRGAVAARRAGAGRVQGWVRLGGALASLALLAGFALWGYRLAVLDVTGVPVVRALEGPMRVAPTDPGGEIIDHQGLAVNEVAAVGGVTDLPATLILAPRPVDLAEEDQAGLAPPPVPGLAAVAALPDRPLMRDPEAAELALAAQPQLESASPTAIAVDAALAEALGLAPARPDPPPEAGGGAAAAIAPAGALLVSPRPVSRPLARAATADAGAAAAVGLPPVTEVDPASIALGTRLVQFGAYDGTDEARAAWAQLQGRFPELMADKAMVLQPAQSGGRTFWRLRAHGFADEAEARRFCSAFVAQAATCIPVPQR